MKIFVTTQFEGFHRWKDAPEEVKFLRDIHRHMFHVRVEIDVIDYDREIEFIALKTLLNNQIAAIKIAPEAVEYSCETYAKLILCALRKVYKRKMLCEVSEDGENGAIVETDDKGALNY